MSTGDGAVVYTQCGLRLRCEFPLDLPIADADEWDLDVRWGDDIADTTAEPDGELVVKYSSEEDSWYTATWTGTHYLFRFLHCGQVEITGDLRHVVVRRDPSGRHTLLPILVAGTMAAFVMTLRGETVLHASAVSVDGRTLAFVGQSGRGKSTMAAMMCAAGAELVSDDLLTVVPGSPPMCRGGADELRLRSTSAGLLDGSPDVERRLTADDRTAVRLPATGGTPRPLTTLVVPTPSREIDRLDVRRLATVTANVALLASPRVLGWERKDVLRRDFGVLGKLAETVPVYEVTVPWGPPFDSGITPAIAALVTSG